MMSKVLLVTLSLLYSASSEDYCTMPCGRRHTMCANPVSGPGPRCTGYAPYRITDENKKDILDFHNKYRQKVAKGLQSPQPSAADMQELVWDDELANIAQRWADQCSMGHDSCRSSKRFYVGQNMAFSGTTASDVDMKNTFKSMVEQWYEEVKFCSPTEVDKFTNKAVSPIGHYTQVVWGSTKFLGCGLNYIIDGKWKKITMFCNYGPGGNMMGAPMYTKGKACSKCPSGSCSRKYDGLCTCKSSATGVLNKLLHQTLMYKSHSFSTP